MNIVSLNWDAEFRHCEEPQSGDEAILSTELRLLRAKFIALAMTG